MEEQLRASSGYAVAQLERALKQAVSAGDRDARNRARAKADRWRAVIDGMNGGTLEVGSRTPVADTPAWVTLEVAHGGFATGRYLAEEPPTPDELRWGADRESVNRYFLSDQGRAELLAALRSESYRIDVPEEAALPVVAWLIDRGHHEQALDLVTELWPLLGRLRFTPRFQPRPKPAGDLVRLSTVGAVQDGLRAKVSSGQIETMLTTLRVWNPLYDRLVELWCETVEGELPRLDGDHVVGGWPCRTTPEGWAERRARWLLDHASAGASPRNAKSNFERLRRALENSDVLSARDVGWVRRALANTITKHGAPGSEARAALRGAQAVVAAKPTHAELARVLAGRLDRYPADGGLTELDPLAEDAAEGVPIPPRLLAKLSRALEAPVETLVERGVIGSGEVLATVLPQLSSRALAANIADPELAALFTQAYGAFRRRRGLLLLNLEHQVRLDELPWIAALAPLRAGRADASRQAGVVLRRATLLALDAFPQTILPNPLVRELGALAVQSGLKVPLVEEVAADIFMGTFTVKWRAAAEITSRVLAGTLYARYYDLPETWQAPRLVRRWGKPVAADFAELCRTRADEAGRRGSGVAANGMVLEQSQILTTHNLAPLVDALDLTPRIRELAPSLAERSFDWLVRRLAMPAPHRHAALHAVKNAAYAWRQAIFYLSFADVAAQRECVAALATRATAVPRLAPAVEGLARVVDGGPCATRFVGWSTGGHWLLGDHA
ncbi:hypothetical protein SAMN05421504_1011231 [Amycolatopsis xylanica]|uniref:Uncharacterized protein n=1 Tax=Amycolatopsis xylanica TaxID=589385 RepID=A0A1H2VHQ9_9PSEU|nr:hypothetical protein [Amycolatopsis xylanica]SDW67886.1 hypothetical protein SAMN05421504_1011231 [Amycolatopsis xylanica]